MQKISKNAKKFVALGGTALFLALGLTGCGENPGNQTFNVVTGDFKTTYLRVNDNNVACFTEKPDSSSSSGTVCDFSKVDIPNGVEVTVLSNNEPEQKDWKLNHLVDLKNKTSDCLYHSSKLVSCNFLSDEANGSFGVEKDKAESSK